MTLLSNTSVLQMRLHTRKWKVLAHSFWMPMIFLIGASIAQFTGGGTKLFDFLPLIMVALVCSSGFFLASVQHELLHRSVTFFLPGFRKNIQTNQLATALTLGVLVFLTVFFVPQIFDQTTSNIVPSWSAACIAISLFATVLYITFVFPYSSYLPNVGIFIGFISFRVIVKLPGDSAIALLGHGALITVICGLVVYFVFRAMASNEFTRSLVERPYLSICDLRDPAKIEIYKQARANRKERKNEGSRPLAGLMSNITEKVARSRVANKPIQAAIWESIYCLLTTTIPRSRFRFMMMALFVPVSALVFGLLNLGGISSGSMYGWFPSFLFQMSYLPALSFFYIRNRPLGRMNSRKIKEISGYYSIIIALAIGLIGNSMIWLLFKFYDLILTGRVLGETALHIEMPLIQGIFVPLMVTPLVFLVTILRTNKRTTTSSEQLGILGFFLYQGILYLVPLTLGLWIVAGLSLLLWLAFPLLWRRRILGLDLA